MTCSHFIEILMILTKYVFNVGVWLTEYSVRGHVQTIFGKINVSMTLRGPGGGGGVACDANFFLCVLLSYCYYYSNILLQLY